MLAEDMGGGVRERLPMMKWRIGVVCPQTEQPRYEPSNPWNGLRSGVDGDGDEFAFEFPFAFIDLVFESDLFGNVDADVIVRDCRVSSLNKLATSNNGTGFKETCGASFDKCWEMSWNNS